MKNKGALLTLVLVVGALAATGCGGGDDSSTSSAATTSTDQAAAGGGGGAAQTVNVSETDFKLDPADPTVNAGSVTLKATNDGQTTHSLEIEGNGIEETSLPNDLAPGDSGEVTVDLSKAGTYEWYCPIANHRAMGMEGTVTVK